MACNGNPIDNDLWYLLHATCNGTFTVSTCALPNVDTILHLWKTNNCDRLLDPEIEMGSICADDTLNCNKASRLVVQMEEGDEFLLQIGNFAATGEEINNLVVDSDCFPGPSATPFPSPTLFPTPLPNPVDEEVVVINVFITGDVDEYDETVFIPLLLPLLGLNEAEVISISKPECLVDQGFTWDFCLRIAVPVALEAEVRAALQTLIDEETEIDDYVIAPPDKEDGLSTLGIALIGVFLFLLVVGIIFLIIKLLGCCQNDTYNLEFDDHAADSRRRRVRNSFNN